MRREGQHKPGPSYLVDAFRDVMLSPCPPWWIMGSLHGLPVLRDAGPGKQPPSQKRATGPKPTYLLALSDRWVPEFIRPNDFISSTYLCAQEQATNYFVLRNIPSRRQMLITKKQKGAERQEAGGPQRHLWKQTIMIHQAR